MSKLPLPKGYSHSSGASDYRGRLLEYTAHDMHAYARQYHEQQAGADAMDAARWRELILHVGGEATPHRGQIFEIRGIEPLIGSNIMKGSVAQHFAEAIDAAASRRAAIAAQAQKKEGV